MADTDLEAIGHNCQYEYCHQLDLLPFRCESCRGTFCLDHRTETAHKCSHAGEWARRKRDSNTGGATTAPTVPKKSTVYNSDQCAHPTCKTLINTSKNPAVHCDTCNRGYCLQHRLREGHDCAKLTPLGARPAGAGPRAANETIRSMFSRVRTWGKDSSSITMKPSSGITLPKYLKPKSASRSSPLAQLNDLKRSARGDASVPADKRIYLHVVGTVDQPNNGHGSSEPPSGQFFFDSRWKVGRILDDAARKLKVENLNNRGGGEEARLRLFHIESGQFLEFSDSIGGEGGKVKSGHTIVLLRGAGVLLQN
jgi:predicted nucleic acid binding AN1-type Zn finger protein